MNSAAFHAKSPEDLGLPLMKAFAKAEKEGASVFRVELDAITYGRQPVQLQQLDVPPKMAVELTAPNGPAVLRGALSIDGKSIRIAGVVLDSPEFAGSALELRAVDRIEIDGVAVIGAMINDERSDDPLVHWVALGPETTASVKRLWIVGNTLTGMGPLLAMRTTGRGLFVSCELEKSVFAGNSAAVGILTFTSKSLALRHFAALEPNLRTTWLDVRDPDAKIELEEGVVATPKLARYDLEPGEKLSDFPEVEARAITFRGPTKKDHLSATGGSFGPRAKQPKDWAFALEPARRLDEPDLPALEAKVK